MFTQQVGIDSENYVSLLAPEKKALQAPDSGVLQPPGEVGELVHLPRPIHHHRHAHHAHHRPEHIESIRFHVIDQPAPENR